MENKKLVFGKMENYKSNFKELPEPIKQFGGLIGIIVIIFITISVLYSVSTPVPKIKS